MLKNEENSRLGKGLSSLLGEKNLSIIRGDGKAGKGESYELDIETIVVNSKQPRKNFNEGSLGELVQSIKKYGVLQPIIVRKIKGGNRYEIVAGERRYRSAKLAGLKTIPVVIKDFDDKDSFSLSIIENIQRENLNSIEEANAYKELIETYKYTQQEIADNVGKSRSHITNLLRLLTLPRVVQQSLIDGKIDMGHARALVNCEFAEDLIDYIVENELSVRDVERVVKDGMNKTDVTVTKKNNRRDAVDDTLKRKIKYLESRLGISCGVNYNEKSKKFVFNVKFDSREELDKFINNL